MRNSFLMAAMLVGLSSCSKETVEPETEVAVKKVDTVVTKTEVLKFDVVTESFIKNNKWDVTYRHENDAKDCWDIVVRHSTTGLLINSNLTKEIYDSEKWQLGKFIDGEEVFKMINGKW